MEQVFMRTQFPYSSHFVLLERLVSTESEQSIHSKLKGQKEMKENMSEELRSILATKEYR